MRAYKTVQVRPSDGGKLKPGLSSDLIGLASYERKLNWRRVLGDESVREGWERFQPIRGISGGQALDSGSSIDLIAEVSQATGKRTLIAASGGVVYRFSSPDDDESGAYVQDDYWEDGYFDEDAFTFNWIPIFSGLTAGVRYECVEISGHIVINNGIDLPVVYKLGWDRALPMYELREQGILRVGTIASFYGSLFCLDLVQLDADQTKELLNGANPYGAKVDYAGEVRNGYSFAWSKPFAPHRWGSLVHGSISQGDTIFRAEHFARSLSVGDSVVVSGAGLEGGNLYAEIIDVSSGRMSYTLSEPAQFDSSDSFLLASDMEGSISGSMDMDGDGAFILAAETLGDHRLVIYSESGYGVLTASSGDSPFAYKGLYSGDIAPHYKHTLVSVNDTYHFFVSFTGCHKVDLRTAEPMPMVDFDVGPDFWTNSSALSLDVYAQEISNTREIWICLPDRTYAFNYDFGSLSEIDSAFSSVAVVDKPLTPSERAASKWVLLGLESGKICRYGLESDAAPSVFTRLGQPYTALLESGLGSFGDAFDEKKIKGYMIVLSSYSESDMLNLKLFAADTPNGELHALIDEDLEDLKEQNLMPLYEAFNYLKDRLTVEVNGTSVCLSARVFEVGRSKGSRPTLSNRFHA